MSSGLGCSLKTSSGWLMKGEPTHNLSPDLTPPPPLHLPSDPLHTTAKKLVQKWLLQSAAPPLVPSPPTYDKERLTQLREQRMLTMDFMSRPASRALPSSVHPPYILHRDALPHPILRWHCDVYCRTHSNPHTNRSIHHPRALYSPHHSAGLTNTTLRAKQCALTLKKSLHELIRKRDHGALNKLVYNI